MQLRRRAIQQTCSRGCAQALEIEGWYASIVERSRRPAPDRRHERNVLGFEPAANEGNDAEGGTVQPLRVIDDQNQRYGVRYFADELEDRDRNAERIRLEVDAQAECRLEGLPLRLGQLRQRADDRAQELVQARKGELGF